MHIYSLRRRRTGHKGQIYTVGDAERTNRDIFTPPATPNRQSRPNLCRRRRRINNYTQIYAFGDADWTAKGIFLRPATRKPNQLFNYSQFTLNP